MMNQNDFEGENEKKMRRKRLLFMGSITVCLLLVIVLGCMEVHFQKEQIRKEQEKEEEVEERVESVPKQEKEDSAEKEEVSAEQVSDEALTEKERKEEEIFTFLQGPKSWNSRLAWSGEWGETFYDGGSFGGFGCGLCCIANLYSSLTKYQCTPVDAYYYAKKKTDYAGGGAIDWGYLRQTLTSIGFTCKVKKKPETYQSFRQDVADSEGTLVLVSSQDSACYWKDTPGHYVTIYLYDKDTDKVFLADSGNPEHNRQWISLRKIYRSLKTESTWQYIPITAYSEKKDRWKHKTAEGNWVRQ